MEIEHLHSWAERPAITPNKIKTVPEWMFNIQFWLNISSILIISGLTTISLMRKQSRIDNLIIKRAKGIVIEKVLRQENLRQSFQLRMYMDVHEVQTQLLREKDVQINKLRKK